MKYTGKQLDSAILNLAEYLNLKMQFIVLLEKFEYSVIIEHIVYNLFLVKFDSRSCTDSLYESYKIIYDYATELEKNGSVEFKSN
jgi:hypothetical protein